MTVNNRFTFEVAYSVKSYEGKNTNWRDVPYATFISDVSDFSRKIRDGHCYTACLSCDEFNTSDKRKCNFRQTNVVSFDFDISELTMEDAYTKTTAKPTLAYTTPSDGIKGNRYRFVYVFSEPFTTIGEYQNMYDTISLMLGFRVPKDDDSLRSPVQHVGGSNGCRMETSFNIYDKEDFINKTNYNFDKNIYGESIFKNNKEKKSENGIILNETFEKDLEELDFREFLEKYRNKYEYFANTPLTFNNGYALIPDNYYEIKRKWVNDTFETSTGIKETRSVYRLKDGDGRRDKMFVQCLIRRKIKPDITLEELVFNLACERQWYFNNDDNQLNNKELIRIARNSLKVDEITIPPTSTGKKFIVDKAYWAERDINANQAKQMIKKMIKNEEIGNLYDPSLTDKENLEVFRQYGMKCSKVTLARWKKANGLTRAYNKKSEMVIINGNNKTEMVTINDKHGIELPKEVEDMFISRLGERDSKVPFKLLRTETVDSVLFLAGWIETMFSEGKEKVKQYKHALNDWFESIKEASLQHDYVRSQLNPEKNDDIDTAAEQIRAIVEKAIKDRFQNARDAKMHQRNAQRELARELKGAEVA